VNHEIEYDVDVGPALFEGRESLTFDEARTLESAFGGDDRGIEALEMPHLQNAPLLCGQSDEVSGLFRSLGNRLLDVHLRTGIEEIARDRVMRGGRRHDAHGIDLTEQLTVIGDPSGVELTRESLPSLGARVRDRD